MILSDMQIMCLKNEPLNKYTTFRIGGPAQKLFIPESREEFIKVLNSLNLSEDKPIIIGAGSNIIISSQGYDGSVIANKNIDRVNLIEENIVYAESGLRSPKLADFCLQHSLSGLEFLAGIPGSVGGAVCMNCSANAQCICNTLIDAEIFNLNDKKLYTKNCVELGLDYRKSDIDPSVEVVISAKFRLNKANKDQINDRMQHNLNFRKNNQPKGFNAGSVFKNPGKEPQQSAGYLLDQAGVKGWREGGAEVSVLHANFINNVDNATSLDVSRLLLRMHNEVKLKFNYHLYPEVKYIGEPTEEEVRIWKILQAK